MAQAQLLSATEWIQLVQLLFGEARMGTEQKGTRKNAQVLQAAEAAVEASWAWTCQLLNHQTVIQERVEQVGLAVGQRAEVACRCRNPFLSRTPLGGGRSLELLMLIQDLGVELLDRGLTRHHVHQARNVRELLWQRWAVDWAALAEVVLAAIAALELPILEGQEEEEKRARDESRAPCWEQQSQSLQPPPPPPAQDW